MIRKIILMLGILILVGTVLAEGNQPTQQSNKIFLNPFYRASMTSGTNYTYNITINPPDKINSVSSAIISFDVYISPTVTFNIWVNGIPCNTPVYTISTTYASAGQSRITFDCSNAITSSGTYTITLKPTSQNTGAVTGWLDLTYMNNPKGKLEVSGTEYSPNDPATMFVQLKDSQGLSISNGSCYLDIYYPLNSSGQHPYTIQDAPMLKALGDDGIYYYDMTAPSTLGVFMLSAKCSYSFNWLWYYPETETIFYPIAQYSSGTWSGGTSQVLNSRQDSLYEKCAATLANSCISNYTFNLSTYGSISNITNINIYYSGQDDTNGKTLTMDYWNGTNFVILSNVLTFTGTATTVPTAYDEFLTNSIPLTSIINNSIKVRLTTTGTSKVFNNWLSIALLSSSGTIQDVKGSSEMHITNIPNATTIQVWNYSTRTLTSINLTGVNITATVDNAAVANAVWTYNNSRNLTYSADATNYTLITNIVNNNSVNYTQVASSVWNYNGTISTNILTQFVTAVWNFSGTISTNILNLIGVANWNSPSRNLTLTQDGTNYSKVAEQTWNYSAKYTNGVVGS